MEKEKLGLQEQLKNENLLREREESKVKVTDTGIYFLPQGEKTPEDNKKKVINLSEKVQNDNLNVKSSDYKRLNQDIEQKVDYLYKFIKNAYNVDTSEYSEAKKTVFIPYYYDNITNEEKTVKTVYIPDYKKNEIIYLGFYESKGEKTAIIKYEKKMNYVVVGNFLGKTTLTIKSISSDNVVLKDNKSGEDFTIQK
ncbi:MAG: hypothetical protein M0R46_03785 [Candidatus Muirbacterium halophilum]|nr:hypothetical protein [Candidatus Muirbacterium halophilum]MCK9475012.1 hypothetical protein [Candidatus Muirbacterium halophilum]